MIGSLAPHPWSEGFEWTEHQARSGALAPQQISRVDPAGYFEVCDEPNRQYEVLRAARPVEPPEPGLSAPSVIRHA